MDTSHLSFYVAAYNSMKQIASSVNDKGLIIHRTPTRIPNSWKELVVFIWFINSNFKDSQRRVNDYRRMFSLWASYAIDVYEGKLIEEKDIEDVAFEELLPALAKVGLRKYPMKLHILKFTLLAIWEQFEL